MLRAPHWALLAIALVFAASVAAGMVLTGRASTAAPTPAAISRDADGGAPAPTATPGARTGEAGTHTVTSVSPPAASSSATAAPAPSPTVVAPTRPKYVVLFVLDGGQPAYYDVPGIPHIRSLMARGTDFVNGMAGILESETPSGHAAIASGSTPNRDGILSFSWANNDNTTDLFDPNLILDHSMEKILANAPAPDIAGLVHRSDPHAQVVVLGGHKYYAQDALGGPEANVIVFYQGKQDGSYRPIAVPGHVPPAGLLNAPGVWTKSTHLKLGVEDHIVMNLTRRAFAMMHPRVLMVNLPEFDWPLGHPHGAGRDPAGVRTLMHGFDRDLGTLMDQYRRAGILNQTMFVLTSDHGFTPIYHTVPADAINNAVTAAGTTVIESSYHTAGYLWLRDSTRAAQAALNIAHLQNPLIQSVYFKSPVPGGGYEYIRASGEELFRAPGVEAANQYLLNTFDGPNGPDVAVLYAEDTANLPGAEATWKGDHGGANWSSQHLRIILAGPGIKHARVTTPAPLIDIAPTVLTLMGIQPAGMQGVALADAMSAATPAQNAARGAQGSKLVPVAVALKAEAEAEVAAGL